MLSHEILVQNFKVEFWYFLFPGLLVFTKYFFWFIFDVLPNFLALYNLIELNDLVTNLCTEVIMT